jgi:hypothetical protein
VPPRHAPPVPHSHVPFVHDVDVIGLQAAHVAPPVPHEPIDSAARSSQVPVVPPTQQPVHVFTSHEHEPLVVSHSPFAHAAHAAPAVPHEDDDSAE